MLQRESHWTLKMLLCAYRFRWISGSALLLGVLFLLVLRFSLHLYRPTGTEEYILQAYKYISLRLHALGLRTTNTGNDKHFIETWNNWIIELFASTLQLWVLLFGSMPTLRHASKRHCWQFFFPVSRPLGWIVHWLLHLHLYVRFFETVRPKND